MRRWLWISGAVLGVGAIVALTWYVGRRCAICSPDYTAKEIWRAPATGGYPCWSRDGKRLIICREADCPVRAGQRTFRAAVIVADFGSHRSIEIAARVIAGQGTLRAFPNEDGSLVYVQSPRASPEDRTKESAGLWLWRMRVTSGAPEPTRVCALPGDTQMGVAWPAAKVLVTEGLIVRSQQKTQPGCTNNCYVYRVRDLSLQKTVVVNGTWLSEPTLSPNGRFLWYTEIQRVHPGEKKLRYALAKMDIASGKVERMSPWWERPRSDVVECPRQPGLVAMIAEHGPGPRDLGLTVIDTRDPQKREQTLLERGVQPMEGLAWHPNKMLLAYVDRSDRTVHVVRVDRTRSHSR
jgi:hypothetical protein